MEFSISKFADIITKIIFIISSVGSIVTFLIAILSFKKLKLEIENLKKEKKIELVSPTIAQIIDFGGDIGKYYQRLTIERKEEYGKEKTETQYSDGIGIGSLILLARIVFFASKHYIQIDFPIDTLLNENKVKLLKRNSYLVDAAKLLLFISIAIFIYNIVHISDSNFVVELILVLIFSFLITKFILRGFIWRRIDDPIIYKPDCYLSNNKLIIKGVVKNDTKRSISGFVAIDIIENHNIIETINTYIELKPKNSESYTIIFTNINSNNKYSAEVGRWFYSYPSSLSNM